MANGQNDWLENDRPVAGQDHVAVRELKQEAFDIERTTNDTENERRLIQSAGDTSAAGEAVTRTSHEEAWKRNNIKAQEEARKREEIAFFLSFLIATCNNQLALQNRLGDLERQISLLKIKSFDLMASGLLTSQHATLQAFVRKQQTPEGSTDSEPAIEPTTVTRSSAGTMAQQPCCRMPLPAPGSPDAPWFKGKNVTDFLEAFNNMCDDHAVRDEDKMKKVIRYCEFKTREYVQTLLYDKDEWESFKKELKKEYEKEDVHQQHQTRAFLERLYSMKREENDRGLKDYCRQYTATARSLTKRGQLDEYTSTRLFLSGLPPKLRRKVVLNLEIDPDDESTMKFKPVFDKAMKYIEAEENLDFFTETPTQRKEIERLASVVRGPQNEGLDFEADPVISARGAADSSVEKLTKQIGALVVPMQAVGLGRASFRKIHAVAAAKDSRDRTLAPQPSSAAWLPQGHTDQSYFSATCSASAVELGVSAASEVQQLLEIP